MKPAPFDYERPTSVDGALQLLASHRGEARVLAGGQSLVPMMNFRIAKPALLVDINRLTELDYHRLDDAHLAIGALCRHATLEQSRLVAEACPLMHEAYRWVAHVAVRNRGTLCGNLCHADPASEMPAVMLALDATLVLGHRSGQRSVAAADFFKGLYETAIRPDELLMEVRVPLEPARRGWGFHEVSVRKGDFAIAAACATLKLQAGRVQAVSIAVAGCGPHAQRMTAAERALSGREPTDAALGEAAQACMHAVDPADDIHGDAAYRRDLVRTLTQRALTDARGRAH